MAIDMDEDALLAAVDLVHRTGATNFEVAFLHEDAPVEEADWYATAQYKGARIISEHHRGPIEAAEALARRLLKGAQCKCGRSVTMSSSGDRKCRWTRIGDRWTPQCDSWKKPPAPMKMKEHGTPWSALEK